MAVNEDCRHYVRRQASADDVTERCKLGANEPLPFACPEGCLLYSLGASPRRGGRAEGVPLSRRVE